MADDDDPIKMIIDGLAHAQGTSLALYHILLDVVTDIAAAQPDPSVYVRAKFEAVSAKLDQSPLDLEAKTASQFEREVLETFYQMVERRALRRRKSSPSAP